MDENTIKLSEPIPYGEGVLEILPGEPARDVLLPVSRYEALIQAETELYILEASGEKDKYAYANIFEAIKRARKLRLEHGCLPIIKTPEDEKGAGTDD